MKKLILNADDFGVSKYIDEGIYKAINAGLINSVSTFVTFDEKNDAAIRRLMKTGVKIGLHFTITAGSPINKPEAIPSIIRKRNNRFHLLKNILVRRINPIDLEKELNAQIEHLENLIGKEKIDHLNMHQNLVYFINKLWPFFINVAKQYNLPVRNPFPFESKFKHKGFKKIIRRIGVTKGNGFLPMTKAGFEVFWNQVTRLRLRGIAQSIGFFIQTLRKQRNKIINYANYKAVSMPDNFVMSYYGQPKYEIIEEVVKAMKDEEHVEFMFHLADHESDFDAKRDYSKNLFWGITKQSLLHRADELQVLLDNEFKIKKLFMDHGVVLANY